jgi:PAS domain S-box-containing protein
MSVAVPADRRPILAPSLGVYALIGGMISFTGYVADLPRFADWVNAGIAIQPNASIAVMAAGVAVVLLAVGHRRLAAVFGTLVFVIGACTLFEWVSGLDLGIDGLLLFNRPWGRAGVIVPGRMGPPGAVSWTLLGAAMLLASTSGGRRWTRSLAPPLALVATTIASLSLIGYLYGVSALYTMPTVTIIALQTTTFILAVSIGVVFCVPERPPARLINDPSPAGALIRRVLPSVILVPIVLGLLRLAGERAGFFDLAVGTAARTMIEIALLSGMLWWAASAIGRQTQARRAAEERLVEQATILRTVTDEARVGLAIVSPQYRYLYANRTYGDIVSHNSADLLGRRVAEIVPDVYEDQIQPRLDQALSGKSVQYDLRLPGDRTLSVSYQPQIENGTVKSAVVMVIDLTDTQLLQRISAEIIHEDDVQSLYEKIVDSAVAIMHSDFASLQMIRPAPAGADDTTLQLLAFRGFNAYAAESWKWVRHDARTVSGAALTRRTRVVVDDISTCDFMIEPADLETFDNTGIRAVQSTPLVSRTGKMLGVISTHWNHPHEPSERELRLFDVLARQAADLIERRQAEESLRDADRRKNEFLATLAHELRNPLAPVRNAVALLKRRNQNDPVLARASDVIERQVVLMARLMDDLLDVGRITSDKLELLKERVDLVTVIRDAIEMCRPLIQQYGHAFTFVEAPEPIYLHADPARLGQVFGNLFNNACRYTERGGRISVTLQRNGAEAVVTVTDNGIGIAREQQAGIFEMFSQVDRALNRPQSGLGIGLHLVKRLVDMHGGDVQVFSEGTGTGSRFTVRLPALPATTAVTVPEVAAPASPIASPGSSRRILVVDDNIDHAESLAHLMQSEGHEIAIAHDGAEALVLAERLRPEVMLLDIGLPVIDGFETCRRLRAEPWGKPMLVIAITGWGQDVDRSRSRDAGFDHHLVKPVDAQAITTLMGNLPAASA